MGSARGLARRRFSFPLFLLVLLSLDHAPGGHQRDQTSYTTVKNDVDTLDSPRAAGLVEGRLTEREALWGGLALFGFVGVVGLGLVAIAS